jgi:hypothetical protein
MPQSAGTSPKAGCNKVTSCASCGQHGGNVTDTHAPWSAGKLLLLQPYHCQELYGPRSVSHEDESITDRLGTAMVMNTGLKCIRQY